MKHIKENASASATSASSIASAVGGHRPVISRDKADLSNQCKALMDKYHNKSLNERRFTSLQDKIYNVDYGGFDDILAGAKKHSQRKGTHDVSVDGSDKFYKSTPNITINTIALATGTSIKRIREIYHTIWKNIEARGVINDSNESYIRYMVLQRIQELEGNKDE